MTRRISLFLAIRPRKAIVCIGGEADDLHLADRELGTVGDGEGGGDFGCRIWAGPEGGRASPAFAFDYLHSNEEP